MRLSYAIVFVSDMSRSVSFYRDILGLPLKFESTEWTEFMTGDATLALHKGEASGQKPSSGDKVQAGQCRPGFAVNNLDDFHSRMLAKGVVCVQAPRDLFGTRIAQYSDPDDVIISVSESKG